MFVCQDKRQFTIEGTEITGSGASRFLSIIKSVKTVCWQGKFKALAGVHLLHKFVGEKVFSQIARE